MDPLTSVSSLDHVKTSGLICEVPIMYRMEDGFKGWQESLGFSFMNHANEL